MKAIVRNLITAGALALTATVTGAQMALPRNLTLAKESKMWLEGTSTVRSFKCSATKLDMHEAGIKAFPAKTEGKGNQLLEPKVVGGVKVYEVTASQMQWETAPGQKVEAWAYNEQVPGPQIRVREGDRVRVILHNKLSESTVIHFHGLELPNAMDGVPFITQPPVKPGESFTYEFTIPEGNHGSHMHENRIQIQLRNGWNVIH